MLSLEEQFCSVDDWRSSLKRLTTIKLCNSGIKPFPALVSDQRFVEWIPSTLMPLSIYLDSCFGQWKGVSVMDSTKIQICHNQRIKGHKVFKDIGRRGKTSVDWFFGFKRHWVWNEEGELLNIAVTAGNIDN